MVLSKLAIPNASIEYIPQEKTMQKQKEYALASFGSN